MGYLNKLLCFVGFFFPQVSLSVCFPFSLLPSASWRTVLPAVPSQAPVSVHWVCPFQVNASMSIVTTTTVYWFYLEFKDLLRHQSQYPTDFSMASLYPQMCLNLKCSSFFTTWIVHVWYSSCLITSPSPLVHTFHIGWLSKSIHFPFFVFI